MFTSEFLTTVRRKALRRGIWFNTLDLVERGIMGLAAHVVDKVESVVLGVEIVKILGKLRDAMKSVFVRRMEEFGVGMAKELASFAVAWGDGAAKKWAYDGEFVMFLTVLDLNQPSGFGI